MEISFARLNILELAGKTAWAHKDDRVLPRHLQLVIWSDDIHFILNLNIDN